MLLRAQRVTESGARLGTRSARRVRFPKGREPPQGAATKPFGVSIFDNWSERGRLRKRRRPQTSKEAASTFGVRDWREVRQRQRPANSIRQGNKLRWLENGLHYRYA